MSVQLARVMQSSLLVLIARTVLFLDPSLHFFQGLALVFRARRLALRQVGGFLRRLPRNAGGIRVEAEIVVRGGKRLSLGFRQGLSDPDFLGGPALVENGLVLDDRLDLSPPPF